MRVDVYLPRCLARPPNKEWLIKLTLIILDLAEVVTEFGPVGKAGKTLQAAIRDMKRCPDVPDASECSVDWSHDLANDRRFVIRIGWRWWYRGLTDEQKDAQLPRIGAEQADSHARAPVQTLLPFLAASPQRYNLTSLNGIYQMRHCDIHLL